MTATTPPAVPPCRHCRGTHVVRNGKTHRGTPSFLCRGCGKRFVADPKKGPVSDDTKALARRLLAERVRLRGICRAVGVSRGWLQAFVNGTYRDDATWNPGPLPKQTATGGW